MTVRQFPCQCSGPRRETVGMVCQTCGRDFAAPASCPADEHTQTAAGLLPDSVPAYYRGPAIEAIAAALAEAERRGYDRGLHAASAPRSASQHQTDMPYPRTAQGGTEGQPCT